jgi:hypothetical protein
MGENAGDTSCPPSKRVSLTGSEGWTCHPASIPVWCRRMHRKVLVRWRWGLSGKPGFYPLVHSPRVWATGKLSCIAYMYARHGQGEVGENPIWGRIEIYEPSRAGECLWGNPQTWIAQPVKATHQGCVVKHLTAGWFFNRAKVQPGKAGKGAMPRVARTWPSDRNRICGSKAELLYSAAELGRGRPTPNPAVTLLDLTGQGGIGSRRQNATLTAESGAEYPLRNSAWGGRIPSLQAGNLQFKRAGERLYHAFSPIYAGWQPALVYIYHLSISIKRWI